MQNLKKEGFSKCFFYNILYDVVSRDFFYIFIPPYCGIHIIIVKVFSRCPYKKMWKFSEQRGYDNTHYLFRFMWKAQFLCLCPHVYSGVGHCIFYFCSGLSSAFL